MGRTLGLGILVLSLGCGLKPAGWIQDLAGTRDRDAGAIAEAPPAKAPAGAHTVHHPPAAADAGAARAIPRGPRRVVPEGANAPLFNDLGDFHRAVSTSSKLAQRFFDQGMTLTYGFNHAEAIRSFQEAQRLDPVCAMCFWGEAYAHGPNINAPMEDASVPAAWAALAKARATVSKATPVERALIEALAKRYGPEPVADRAPLDRAYADAMRGVARSFPDDDDVQALFAEAMMDTTPWDYYESPESPKPATREAITVLETVLARNPDHPGAIHFYIHAVEPSTTPQRAEAPADRLRGLVPGAGHLVHMPSHIYLRVGRFHDASVANEKAAAADESYIHQCRAQGFYPLVYYPHNVHFLWTAATFEGRSRVALASAGKLVSLIPPEMIVEAPPIEEFLPTVLFTLVRFGAWEEILEQPKPDPERRYMTGMWHYARGMALAATGKTAGAKSELAALGKIAGDESLAGMEFFSFATPTQLLEIATDVLAARIAGAGGDWDAAIPRLEHAVAVQDSLRYTEPPPWHFPVRDALGWALLRAGRAKDAVAVYRQQLEKMPNSGWTLYGLAEALRESGDADGARETHAAFENAWARSDIEITASVL